MATRALRNVVIEFDGNGNVTTIMAMTEVAWQDGGLEGTESRPYKADYEDLGLVAQQRVDAFVNDVRSYIEAQESLSS